MMSFEVQGKVFLNFSVVQFIFFSFKDSAFCAVFKSFAQPGHEIYYVFFLKFFSFSSCILVSDPFLINFCI